MSGLDGLLSLAGPAAGLAGTVGLVFIGKWVLRAQAIAQAFKFAGIVIICIGVLSTAGIVELNPGRLVELVVQALDLYDTHGGGW